MEAQPAAALHGGQTDSTERLGLPPGPRSPGKKQTLDWMFRPIQFMDRCRERYGRIFSMRLGPKQNVVMVGDPQIAKQIFAGDPAVFRAGATNGIFRPVVGSNSILLLDGEAHQRQRKILLQGFGPSHAAGFAEQVRQIAEQRISGWQVGQKLRLQDEMEAISFDAIMRVVFGEEPPRDDFRELIPELMDRCDSPFTLIPWFRRELGGTTPYARLMRVLDRIDELIFGVIEERRRDPLTQLREDTISLLLRAEHEDGSPISDREVRDEVLTLIMAGYETTTSGLSWAFERLLRSPEQLSRLTAEVAEGREEYLDAVVRETLRVRPVIPVVARQLAEPVELGGYSIPAGSTVMISIYLIHTDPQIYPEPGEFRPERFLGGPPEGATWIPFGGGARRCIGHRFGQLEMKVVLNQVIASARLRAGASADERYARKRFTLAPERGATAVVEELIPPQSELGTRRFRRSTPRVLAPHS